MADPNQRSIHEYAVCAFLGGISFNTMVVVMQSEDKFQFHPWQEIFYFPEIVIGGLAIVSSFFIIATIGMIPVAANRKSETTAFATFAYKSMLVGFYGLCAMFPLLLLPFSLTATVAVIIVVVSGTVLYMYLYDKD